MVVVVVIVVVAAVCSIVCVLSTHVVVWHSGSTLVSINKVNLRWAWLELVWVTMSGFNSQCWTFISVCN